MSFLILAGAAFSVIYGLFTVFRPKTPLFYKIVFYGFGSYFLAVAYSFLYMKLISGASGFHAGYLGYVGLFFFLFSSYLGALDSLADGGDAEYKKYRIVSLLPSVLIFLAGIGNIYVGRSIYEQVLLIPVIGTAYFACKHLIIPDVEMGIIRVMRIYNGVILLLCMIQPWTMVAMVDAVKNPLAVVTNTVLVMTALPAANRGYHKWFT